MRKDDVIRFYGSQSEAAKALGYTVGAVSQWDDIIPELSARKFHDVTRGKLRFDPKLYAPKCANKRTAAA